MSASGSNSSRRVSPRVGLAAAAIAMVAVVFGSVVLLGGGESPEQRLDEFLIAWSQGDDAEAAELTDRPDAALEGLEANRAGLDGAELSHERIGDIEEFAEGEREATVRLDWEIPEIGPFGYETRIVLLDDGDGGWVVEWRPDLVHPSLMGPNARLGTVREWPERGRILDRNGVPLVQQRPVKRVGVIAGEVERPRVVAEALAGPLELDPEPLARQIDAGGPEQFIEAVTLRPEDFRAVEAALQAGVPQLVVIDAERPLAPTRDFGRALLGDVRELTAEQLEEMGSPYAVGDAGGQWGLQAAYESELAGTPRRAVVIRVQGVPTEELHAVEGDRPADLETTLDLDVQAAAEAALGEREESIGLVVMQASTGDLAAVANRPTDEAFNRALEGRYPPGSTFKVVTAAALLDTGELTPQTTVECPLTYNVGGREFRNFEGGGGGTMPFSRAFAESCNTAFIALAERELTPRSLPSAAAMFGLGDAARLAAEATAGDREAASSDDEVDGEPAADDDAAQAAPGRTAIPIFTGEVPVPEGPVSFAAAAIGQDRILVSPAAMAGVAATVAAGRSHAPRLISTDPALPGEPLPLEPADELRAMMREVVTSGTGTALAGIAGEVHGKSGTAEYGEGDPPSTHAWFIAYRDDIAIAVLVEDGTAGGEVAAPIAADFFAALDGA